MKDQPWDLNKTWPVGWKWCRFTNAPQKFRGTFPPKFGAQNIKFSTTFLATSALDTEYLRNETLHRQTNMQVSIYNAYPQADLFSVTFDPETAEICLLIVTQHSFHYVAPIKVATSLVMTYRPSQHRRQPLCFLHCQSNAWHNYPITLVSVNTQIGCTQFFIPGSHYLLILKFKDLSRTFKDPQISFSRTNSRRKFTAWAVEQQYLMFIYVTMVQ